MSTLGSFIWSIADQLRGPYRPNQYGSVILPLTILRRLDCILEPDREVVRELAAKYDNPNRLKVEVSKATGRPFYNTSNYSFANLLADADGLADNLMDYIDRFSPDVDVFEYFDFKKEILALEKAELLREIVKAFGAVDLHPNVVSNSDMGDAFEYIIRKFNEAANETSGDHYTPRDAIRLLVDLLFAEEDASLSEAGIVRSLYDPTAGTGGMLSLAEEHLLAQNPDARLSLYGQEYNSQSYAICKSDMIAKGNDATNIAFGNTLTEDAFKGRQFDFCMSNPPYGVEWKQYAKAVKEEQEQAGPYGRFAPGLPSTSDGQMLFLLHLAHKMRAPEDGGGRVGIVMNGSPLFNGRAPDPKKPNESSIRQWLLEKDLVEAIVALPTSMFFNTGIATYIWILDNNKHPDREGLVQLIDATSFWTKMRRNLGSKGREISDEDRAKVVKLYADFKDAGQRFSKVMRNDEFGYWAITVERPLLDEDGQLVVDRKGKPKPDSKGRDTENVPFTYGGSIAGAAGKLEVIQAYFDAEVKPHVPDAWIDWAKVKTGYEVPFTRHFYKYIPPRPLAEIDADLDDQIAQIMGMLREIEANEHSPYPDYQATSIDWIEELPAHWGTSQVGREVWVRARLGWKGLTADEYVLEGGVPMLATPNIKTPVIDYEGANRITDDRYLESPEIMLSEGDVLLTKDGSTIGTVNVVRDLPEPATVNGSIAVLTPNDRLDGRYLYWLIASGYAQSVFGRLRAGMGVPHLFQRDINRIRIPMPPLDEQSAIADFLDRETRRIDELLTAAEGFIALAHERRSALVTAAVTGRIDVRGVS